MEKLFQNEIEFKNAFSSEEQCLSYLYDLRWPGGYQCPRCQGNRAWQIRRYKYKCQNCGYQTSVTAGTLFQDTHKPLPLWFRAIWYVASREENANALELQKIMGLGSYRTAWTWLHKLRQAMAPSLRKKLAGDIEAGVAYVGSIDVFIIASVQNSQVADIRIQLCPEKEKSAYFQAFLNATVSDGSRVKVVKGFIQRGNRDAEYTLAAMAALKDWLAKTRWAGYSQENYLGYYLDEYCFKYNRQAEIRSGALCYELLYNAVHLTPVTYQEIIDAK